MPSIATPPSRSFRRISHALAGLFCGIVLALAGAPATGSAQEPGPQAGGDALRVYLDCSGGWRSAHCNRDLYRQEITFVNWVREPQDAQVHVILTSQDAGGGGNRYSLDFIGREGLGGMEDEYVYSSSVTDVEDEIVEGLVRTLRLGLVRYAAAAGFGEDLEVAAVADEVRAARALEGTESVSPDDDPWNFWIFNIEANASFESEDLQDSREVGFGVNANRTTEAWKFNLRANGNFEREKFEIPQEDGSVEIERNDQDRWTVSGFGVKTLGDHWGVGAQILANNSTQLNRELLLGLGSGIEYNYFPYSQSNRRVLLARYVVAVEAVQYQDTTVFDVLEETVYQHELNLDYDAREPWGNASIGMGLSQYLDRTDAWSFNVRGFVRYRLFRGFSISLNGQYRKVEDQIYLSKERLSDSDIFLGRRQLPTSSEVEFRVGLSYSFGSIFNNAVNERFRRGVF